MSPKAVPTVTCPRCGCESVELTSKDRKMLAHKDPLVKDPCPMRGKTIDGAREAIDQERERVGLPPMDWRQRSLTA